MFLLGHYGSKALPSRISKLTVREVALSALKMKGSCSMDVLRMSSLATRAGYRTGLHAHPRVLFRPFEKTNNNMHGKKWQIPPAGMCSCAARLEDSLRTNDVTVVWSRPVHGRHAPGRRLNPLPTTISQGNEGKAVLLDGGVVQRPTNAPTLTSAAFDPEEALNVTFDQLPMWFDTRRFDWSGNTNYTAVNKKFNGLPPIAADAAGSCRKVRVDLEGGLSRLLVLWIAVHQPEEGGPARLYESICPVDGSIVDALAQPLVPFYSVSNLAFTRCNQRVGAWRNYLIGVVGTMAAAEEDVLWPNQVIHADRTIHNLRGAWDLAKFLADPVKEDVEAHLENLRLLQEERQYKEGWSQVMLRSRWGETTLRQFNMDAVAAQSRVS